MSTTWNPDLYLRFQPERTQASIDLVSRIKLDSPATIIEIGCGPGNSTSVLASRWPSSVLTGVDSSEEMVARASQDYPDWLWIHADVRDLPSEPTYDLVFSNATLQWIPDHEALIPHIYGMIRGVGAFAVQIPLFEGMPVRQAIAIVATRSPWRALMSNIASLVVHEAGFYYDLLTPVARSIVIWQTAYVHEMESHASIVEMMKSTALRPYLERIDVESDRDLFLMEVTDEVAAFYPTQRNGRVLFPFNRLFFIAYR